jgi:hypothetical protein
MRQTLLGMVIVRSNQGLIAATALLAILTIYEIASGNLLFSLECLGNSQGPAQTVLEHGWAESCVYCICGVYLPAVMTVQNMSKSIRLRPEIRKHYNRVEERSRLFKEAGELEFHRTKELISRRISQQALDNLRCRRRARCVCLLVGEVRAHRSSG